MEIEKVLDHGYVKLVDVFGSDSRIVEAARVSTNAHPKSKEGDESLIRYLLRNAHTSPFEMCEMIFEMKLPIFVARQLVRHRTANINEVSGRYTILESEAYLPKETRLTTKNLLNKQSSSDKVVDFPEQFIDMMRESQGNSFGDYEIYNTAGIASEISRINLPVATYTKWYWKCDLHNILHFLKLRLDTHAQYEIRVYAEAMARMVKNHFPMTWAAFEDYTLNSLKFSQNELNLLAKCIDKTELTNLLDQHESLFGKSEFFEFKQKLESFL